MDNNRLSSTMKKAHLKNNRNTNYFGEILIYLTFAIACGRKEGYIMLIIEWIIFFGSRIYLKDLRLAL